MAAKKNPLDSIYQIADHYDQIKNTNSNLTETQILEIVSKATGQTTGNIKKRWKLIKGVDWQVFHYLEKGIIGMTRAMNLIDNNLDVKERMAVLEKSLDENIADSDFKGYMATYLARKEEAES